MCSQGQHADLAQEKDRISLCPYLVCFRILLESRQSCMLALALDLDTNCVPFCLGGSFLTESSHLPRAPAAAPGGPDIAQ